MFSLNRRDFNALGAAIAWAGSFGLEEITIFEGLDLIRCVTHDPRGGLAKLFAAARHWFGLCFSGFLLLALWSVLVSHVYMMTQGTGFAACL